MGNEKARALTDVAIQKAQRPDKKKWIRDGGGLALCLTPGKSEPWRHWFFIYISPESSKKCYKPLGSYPATSLSEARKQAVLLRAAVAKGTDPIAEERRVTESNIRATEEARRVKQAEDNAISVSKLANEYMEKHAKKNKRATSADEDERLLNKNILPAWRDRKAQDIKKRDVVLLLESYADRPALTQNIFKLVRKMFNFAVSRDILENTPCIGIAIDEIASITSRERVLKEPRDNNGVDEILTFWTELEKASMSSEVKRILKLILITGQRPGEVAGINSSEISVEQWEEKDDSGNTINTWSGTWWTIPVARRKVKEKSKNPPQPHRVYLSNLALEVLGQASLGGYYFPSPKCKEPKNGRKSRKKDINSATTFTHIDDNAVAYAVRKNLKNYKPRRKISGDSVKMVKVKEERKMIIEHFTPHDLRRTCSTRLSELGFRDEINDAILGHAKKGVISIYNKYQYAREKILAAQLWERKLLSIIAPQSDVKSDSGLADVATVGNGLPGLSPTNPS